MRDIKNNQTITAPNFARFGLLNFLSTLLLLTYSDICYPRYLLSSPRLHHIFVPFPIIGPRAFCRRRTLLDHSIIHNAAPILPEDFQLRRRQIPRSSHITQPSFDFLFRRSFIAPSADQHRGHITTVTCSEILCRSLSRAQVHPIFLSLSYYF